MIAPYLLVGLLASSTPEPAAPEDAEAEIEEAMSAPDAIFGHVGDGKVWEIENPFHGTFGGPERFFTLNFGLPRRGLTKHGGLVVQLGLDWRVQVAGQTIDLTPTKHTLMMWIVALILFISVWQASRKRALVPRGWYSFVEMIVQWIYQDIAKNSIPDEKEAKRYTPYLISVFFFILFMNLWGLIPFMSTPTGNIGLTAGLALCTFTLTQIASIRASGVGGYLKHLTGDVHWLLWVIMIPVEVLGLFTKPFALCIRLFANMIAGHIVIFFLISLIFIMGIGMFAVSVPFALGIFLLEIFVGFIQAYVFTMLSALFIGLVVEAGQHGHQEHAAAESHH
jgi:F-type H+-transporting ATPase subunit a